jgi:formyltetrahydrofolate-dependent phosphoribosylglycinamide formyltransferase
VISDKSEAGALTRARARGVPTHVVTDARDSAAVQAVLQEHGIDLVVLAGWLKLVPPALVLAWHGRMINVHPALLPAFGGPGMFGMNVHRAVVAAGVQLSGATVHFVNEHFDRGAIAAQWPVPVYSNDTPDTVAERVLRVEHLLLPVVTQALAAGTLALGHDGRVFGHISRESAQADVRATRFTLSADHPDTASPSFADAVIVARAAFAYDVAHLFHR